MQHVRQRNTAAEMALRSALHRMGMRYRLHQRVLPGSTRTADLAFRSAHIAVFIDSCFWHGCPEHATWPKANARWWAAKIEANKVRDLDTNERLSDAGWRPIRVWEHEDPNVAAVRVVQAVRTGQVISRGSLRSLGHEVS